MTLTSRPTTARTHRYTPGVIGLPMLETNQVDTYGAVPPNSVNPRFRATAVAVNRIETGNRVRLRIVPAE
jgi:hypothetical protein